MTARATARASASSRAPVTSAVMSVAAPSPSAACWRARSRADGLDRGAEASRPRACRPGPARRPPPGGQDEDGVVRARVAVDATAGPRSARRPVGAGPTGRSGATAASVSTIESIVAIIGWIIPTPLAMPLTVTVRGARRRRAASTRRRRGLGHRVGRPQGLGGGRETRRRSACRVGTSASSPAATLSSGRRVPMTPVERWSVVVHRRRRAPRPAAAATSSWSASPAAPVAALALPLVEMTASAQPNPPRASPESRRDGPSRGGPARPRTCSG